MSFFQRISIFSFFIFLSFSKVAYAHAPNQSYIFLYVYEDSIRGNYEVNTTDLNKVFDLGLTGDLTFEELQPNLPMLKKYALEHLAISSNLGDHPISINDVKIWGSSAKGAYLQFWFNLENVTEIPDALNIKYDGIFKEDPTHRGLQVVAYNWKAGILDNEALVSLTFSPDNTEQELDLTEASIWKGFLAMVESGIHHILIGNDHILFLIALILPGVVRRRRRREEEIITKSGIAVLSPMAFSEAGGIWEPVERFKPALMYVLTIITFFTLAHSITLSLAALGIFTLPIRFVESIIALSIALAAYHNIRPIFKKDWMIAFGFGLFHGFGFASVLGEVGLAGEFMTLSLLGFNIGVEVGQIAIIAIVFPVLYFIRNLKIYPPIIVYGSIALIFISLYWFAERALDVDIPLGAFVKSFF